MFRKPRLVIVFAATLAVALRSGFVMAGNSEPIVHKLRFSAPHTHYVEVDAAFPTAGREALDLFMAVWTPGSYLIREYSRHVEELRAEGAGGKPLAVEKTRKNRWRVDTGGEPRVSVSYRVYCHDMSVRGNWVDSEFALINSAATFLAIVDDERRPHEVEIVLPAAWSAAISALPSLEGTPHRYRAADFDTLVDSPTVAGNPALYEFDVAGKRHRLVNIGEGGVWDGARAARDVEKIVAVEQRMWGDLPYDQYTFFNLITEGRGGLEHRNSTVLMTSRWNFRVRKDYLRWLGLVSHEFFHTWNVKRLRPLELGPFDYETEVYTRSLWVAEGVTSYYTDLLVRRAGLCSREEYLESLSKLIERLQETPGRAVHSLEESSFDAWIKLYRSDENSVNSTISYYNKGAVVAFLLDARIRRATAGAASLDDAMVAAYRRFSAERGFTGEQFRGLVEEIAGEDLKHWFETTLESTEELDYSEALEWFGLRFKDPAAAKKEQQVAAGKAAAEEKKGWLGLTMEAHPGRLVVIEVRRKTPGFDAGFNVEDEILAIDDYRVVPDRLAERLEQYRPGERATVLVARRQRLVRLNVTFGEEPAKQWTLEPDPKASETQKQQFDNWLR